VTAGAARAVAAGWWRFLARAGAGEWVTGDVGRSIGAAVGVGGELCEGLETRLGLGEGLLPFVGVGGLGIRVGVVEGEGFGDGVRLGVGDGFGLGVGDGFGLGVGDGVGEVCDGVGLGVGEVAADVGLAVGSRFTDTAANAAGDEAMIAATKRPNMATRRMRATRYWLATADLGHRRLVLKIQASKVTIASGLHAANVSKQVKANNTL
jgi:hypothetical protein